MIARLGRSALRVRPRDVAVAARTRLSSASPAAAPQPPAREAARDELGRAYATGRRKSSSARVWVFPGDGRVRVKISRAALKVEQEAAVQKAALEKQLADAKAKTAARQKAAAERKAAAEEAR